MDDYGNKANNKELRHYRQLFLIVISQIVNSFRMRTHTQKPGSR